MTIYGYVRVSTRDQNEDRQLIAMIEHGVQAENIVIDKQSGKDFERPGYKKLIKEMVKGDVLIIKSIDRLGRNYDEILDQWRHITKVMQVDIFVIDMPLLDTRTHDDNLTKTFVADMVLQILSYVAQNERENIRRRQREGIDAARAKGVKFGRPFVSPPDNFREIVSEWENNMISFDQALELSGLSRSTFYRRKSEIQ